MHKIFQPYLSSGSVEWCCSALAMVLPLLVVAVSWTYKQLRQRPISPIELQESCPFNYGPDEVNSALFPLNDEERHFIEEVVRLLASPDFGNMADLTEIEKTRQSYKRFRKVKAALDLRLADCKERPRHLVLALGLIAAVDGTLFTIMSIHYCLCGGTILHLGNNIPAIKQYIDELDSLESVGVFLVTEIGYGNNVVSLQTRADFDPKTRNITLNTPFKNACKFMPNTGQPDIPKIAVVMARLYVHEADMGVFPFLVCIRDKEGLCPGVSVALLGEKSGYPLDNAITCFKNVVLPKSSILLHDSELSDDGTLTCNITSKRERFLASMELVQMGRLCLSAAACELLTATSFIAIKYADQRFTFAPQHADVPILDYQNLQRDVFLALGASCSSRCMLSMALDKLVPGTTADGLTIDEHATFRIVAATKVYTTYAAQHFAVLCRERCGAVGLFDENRIAMYACQARGLVTAEGDNHILLLKVARQMLMLQGYSPPVLDASSGQYKKRSLKDLTRLMNLMKVRESKLHSSLRRTMSFNVFGKTLFAHWNDNICTALDMARAHVNRLAYEALLQRTESQTTGLKEAHKYCLENIAVLQMLEEVAVHSGFYLAHGLLTKYEVLNGISTLRVKVLENLRPHAVNFVSCLGIGNDILRAPIAGDFVEFYNKHANFSHLE